MSTRGGQNGDPSVRPNDTASYNPLWSPDGFIVYSEPLQGSTFVTKAITLDKVSVPIPDIRISYLTPTPYRFAMAAMRSYSSRKAFPSEAT